MQTFSVRIGERIIDIEYATTYDDIAEVQEEISTWYTFYPQSVIGIDLETAPHVDYPDHPSAGLCPHLSRIRLVQLSYRDKTYVIDCFAIPGWQQYLKFRKSCTFVAHNAIFELKHLKHVGIDIADIHCSQIESAIVTNAEESVFDPTEEEEDEDTEPEDDVPTFRKGRHSLFDACGRTLGYKISKDLQTSNWAASELSEEQITYAGLDAWLTAKLHLALYPRVREYGMEKVYTLYKEMQHVVADIELEGMYVNKEAHFKLIKEWENDERKHESECRRFFGPTLNINSTKQLGEWLERTFAGKPAILETWPKTKTGRYAFGYSKLAKYKKCDWIGALLAYKKTKKLISTYGHKLSAKINPITGRLHTGLSVGRTATGRLSSHAPNLQNMPRNGALRTIFEASSGCSLAVADFNQIEMRVAGEVSKDETILRAFDTSTDLHKTIVHMLTNKPLKDITKEDRQLGKAINFGLLFGMGPKKLAHTALVSYDKVLTEEQAKAASNIFHKVMYKGYSAYCSKQRANARQTLLVRTPLGKLRKLAESECYTKPMNTDVQGGAAEVCQIALVVLRKWITAKKLPIKILLQVHDEIITEQPVAYGQVACDLVTEAMKKGMQVVFPTASLKGLVEAKTGGTWHAAKN